MFHMTNDDWSFLGVFIVLMLSFATLRDILKSLYEIASTLVRIADKLDNVLHRLDSN
jgi:hypothetical protein